MRTTLLLLFLSGSMWGQSVMITSPADGANIQAVNLTNGRELAITSTVVEGSGNHTYRVCATMNDRPINPQNCSYSAPWTIKAYPGLPGDGDEVYQVTTYDVFGNVLATSPTHTIHSRQSGFVSSVVSAPTSGTGTLSFNVLNGRKLGGGCFVRVFVDGFPIPSGASPYASSTPCSSVGVNYLNFDKTKWPNGRHEILGTANDTFGNLGGDPVVVGSTFGTGDVNTSTNVITLTAPQNHDLTTNLPVNFLGSPPSGLAAGLRFEWKTSTSWAGARITSNVASGGVITVGLSAVHGGTAGVTKVDLHNFLNSNTASYTDVCDGLYTMASTPTGSSFTVTAPNCPDGSGVVSGAEVVVNPYYAIFDSNTTAKFAATPNGSAITLTTRGSGTMTAQYRLRPGYWSNNNPFDGIENGTPLTFARQVVDFENGTMPMRYDPAFLEMNGVVGTSGPSLCGKVINTDLTSTSIDCSMVTYTVVPDGGFTGVVTVNPTTGIPTYAAAGWAKITSTYSTFPAVTTSVHTYTSAVTNNHFTRDGHIATAYTPGQSFTPTNYWGIDCVYATAFQPLATRARGLASLMFDSGMNTCMTNSAWAYQDAATSTSCGTPPYQNDTWYQQWASDWLAKYGTPVSFEFDLTAYTNPTLTLGASPLIQNIGFDRKTCIKNYVQYLKLQPNELVYHWFLQDEVDAYIGGASPNLDGLVGGKNFTNITVAGGAGASTVHVVNMSMRFRAWNQANGTGTAVFFDGATTNPCLNGWKYVTSTTPDSTYSSTFISAFTYTGTCGNGTYDATSDPGLTLHYFYNQDRNLGTAPSPHACILPKYVGSFDYIFQGWSTVSDGFGTTATDTTLSSIVVTGSGTTTYTIHITGHGWAEGHAIWISGATTAALNGLYNVHVIDADTVSVTGTAAAGTYKSGTDSGLLIGYDCAIPNDYFKQLHDIFQAGGSVTISPPILGASYNTPPAIGAWNQPTLMEGGLLYHSDPPDQTYGEGASVYQEIQSNKQSGLTTRAYQVQPRADLDRAGIEARRVHKGYFFVPGLDNPQSFGLAWRPENRAASIMTSVTWGVTGFREFKLSNDPQGVYNFPIGGYGLGNSIGPEMQKMWASIGRTFWAVQHLNKYILQPHANAPYLGPMFSTVQTTSSYGNMLLSVCLVDGGSAYPLTVDLTGIRRTNGSIYRMSLTGYRLRFDALAGNPASDTYTHCGGGIGAAGETVAYVAQPSGATSDLTPTTFTPPATLPYGASHFAVRYGYYPRDMADDPVEACDAGCTINLMRAGGPVWFQILYLDANRVPLAMGDAQMLAGQ